MAAWKISAPEHSVNGQKFGWKNMGQRTPGSTWANELWLGLYCNYNHFRFYWFSTYIYIYMYMYINVHQGKKIDGTVPPQKKRILYKPCYENPHLHPASSKFVATPLPAFHLTVAPHLVVASAAAEHYPYRIHGIGISTYIYIVDFYGKCR